MYGYLSRTNMDFLVASAFQTALQYHNLSNFVAILENTLYTLL